MTSFAQRKTLITGAASGIGRATAQAAAAAGAHLVLTDINAELLQSAADEIVAQGGTVLAQRAFDISDATAVADFASDVHAAHGAMDIIMNVAGISTWGRIEDLELRHWDQLIDINLRGPIFILHEFVPPLIKAGNGGHIVNVSSAAGLFGLPLHAAYSATKFGVRGIHEVLRFDLQSAGIKSTLVCPGAVNTPLVGTVTIVGVDRDDPEVQQQVSRFQRHAVTPEQAAASIVKGVTKNKELVFTSPDIKLGHFAQRFFPWGYNFAMRRLNREIMRLLREKKGEPV